LLKNSDERQFNASDRRSRDRTLSDDRTPEKSGKKKRRHVPVEDLHFSSDILEHVLPAKRKSNSLNHLESIEEENEERQLIFPLERADTMRNIEAPESHFFGIKSLEGDKSSSGVITISEVEPGD
jgi:trehalose-6-phosphate synthase